MEDSATHQAVLYKFLSRSFLSTASIILDIKIMQKTLLGMDSKVIPLQLLQLVKSPDFGILMMLPSACTINSEADINFLLKSEVRQGYVISSVLCIIAIDWVMRTTLTISLC
jgi:hypothetical protein